MYIGMTLGIEATDQRSGKNGTRNLIKPDICRRNQSNIGPFPRIISNEAGGGEMSHEFGNWYNVIIRHFS